MTDTAKLEKPRPKKERKPCVSKLHPGSAEVAKAMGWNVDVVRALAVVALARGGPVVRGGRGFRFQSVEAFRSWFMALPPALRRSVPEVDRAQRLALAEEIYALTWQQGDPHALARRLEHGELVEMRDRWKALDDTEKGERAAKAALARRKA